MITKEGKDMKKVLTIILDGFGLRNTVKGNAVKLAKMPNFTEIWNKYPHSQLLASERAVGLEKGQMGNSEVGHTTIGAGRLIKQNFMEITDWFSKKEILKNQTFQEMINYAKENDKPIHMLGLLSDGGIHSHIKFNLSMLDYLHEAGVKKVYVHAITDGRDTATTVSCNYIDETNAKLKEYGYHEVASVCGRYYAMDRDKKWDRTKLYSDMLTNGAGAKVKDIKEAINFCYKKNVTDEFLPPIILDDVPSIQDGDIVLWMNYRPDRAKQILRVLTDYKFSEYETKKFNDLKVYTIYPIEEAKNSKHFLDNQDIKNSLGVYLADLGMKQARIAETEKYAHVTYFFDGGKEYKLANCDRFLIPSPKVATYDLQPEMSCQEVTKTCLSCMEKDYDFILMNYANPDMVGHTGNLEAAIKALEAIDGCLGRLLAKANETDYTLFILADHGNCDYMLDENNNVVTTHSLFPVPFIVTDENLKLKNGDLTMVAPTILEYMDIAVPKEMKETKTLIASSIDNTK